MLEIVTLKNPFDRTRRETERVAFVPGQVLTKYIPDQEVVFVLNGNFVEQPELTFPCDGDQIIVLPHVGHGGFKGILGMIASIALMTYVGSINGGKEAWALFGAGKATLATYLAAGAVMYVGGRIINSVFPTQQKGLGDYQSSSPTYGWDMPSPVSGEGGVVGITYGECIPAPQVLERHVETVNGQQYLKLLLCGGIGPVDDIYDIKIGSTAIYNFQDIQIETRNGINDQTPISFFTDTPLDQAVGLELTESGLIQTSDSTKAVSLEVTVEFPGGLYHLKDDGGFENDTVIFSFQYRKNGDPAWSNYNNKQAICNDSGVSDVYCYPDAPQETWTVTRLKSTGWFYVTGSLSGKQEQMAYRDEIFDNGKIRFRMNSSNGTTIYVIAGTFSISAAQNTAVRRSYRIYGPEAARYDVRLAITSRHTGSRYGNTCTWSVLTAYNPGQYARPNKVLVGLRILATNQLSGGIPDITWRQVRNSVYVWNPDTGKYETRSARNPIWAAYDIYHQCRYMKNISTGQYEYVV